MSRPSPAEIVQNAYVVRDLDEACARLHERYHVGPFVGGTEFELGAIYTAVGRGRQSECGACLSRLGR